MTNKSILETAVGLLGSGLSYIFGGWDSALTTLIIFMAIDYITGLLVAGVFQNSNKTETGGLESRAGLKGLIRKGMMIAIVYVAYRLDAVADTEIVGVGVSIAFIVNEAISLIENAGLMGIPMPSVLTNAIELLKKNSEEQEEK